MSEARGRCARTLTRAQFGLAAPLVEVEAHVGPGLPNFTIVGLPAPVVRESRERVRAAIVSSGFDFPPGRITVNLAPAELTKQGGRFDLPIALAVLIATDQLRAPPMGGHECYGELGLTGELRPVGGLFLAALHAQSAAHPLIVPYDNLTEARLTGHAAVQGAADLRAAALCLAGQRAQDALPAPRRSALGAVRQAVALERQPSLLDVVGQWHAKRALTIAAAGGHSLLMVGPPGSGKSMLAARLPGLLPPLSASEALEVASIASTAGLTFASHHWTRPPFRAPHHSASTQAIVGGGPQVQPGEISLAHHGVLFLDELPEFDRRVLESLREPLETGAITIARARSRLELPARFQLIAAMNPCPCGYYGDASHPCQCGPGQIQRYRQRISGPLLDRIDLRVEVPRLVGGEWMASSQMAQRAGGADGADGVDGVDGVEAAPEPDAAEQVRQARQWRLQRSGCVSAQLNAVQLQRCCALSAEAREVLAQSVEELALSGRGISKLLAVGRTIADLGASESIEAVHLAEAVQLRRPLKFYWASDSM